MNFPKLWQDYFDRQKAREPISPKCPEAIEADKNFGDIDQARYLMWAFQKSHGGSIGDWLDKSDSSTDLNIPTHLSTEITPHFKRKASYYKAKKIGDSLRISKQLKDYLVSLGLSNAHIRIIAKYGLPTTFRNPYNAKLIEIQGIGNIPFSARGDILEQLRETNLSAVIRKPDMDILLHMFLSEDEKTFTNNKYPTKIYKIVFEPSPEFVEAVLKYSKDKELVLVTEPGDIIPLRSTFTSSISKHKAKIQQNIKALNADCPTNEIIKYMAHVTTTKNLFIEASAQGVDLNGQPISYKMSPNTPRLSTFANHFLVNSNVENIHILSNVELRDKLFQGCSYIDMTAAGLTIASNILECELMLDMLSNKELTIWEQLVSHTNLSKEDIKKRFLTPVIFGASPFTSNKYRPLLELPAIQELIEHRNIALDAIRTNKVELLDSFGRPLIFNSKSFNDRQIFAYYVAAIEQNVMLNAFRDTVFEKRNIRCIGYQNDGAYFRPVHRKQSIKKYTVDVCKAIINNAEALGIKYLRVKYRLPNSDIEHQLAL